MLAYELYLQNKESGEVIGKSSPAKKIFIKDVSSEFEVQIDKKTLEEYGGNYDINSKGIQQLLSAPSLFKILPEDGGLPNRSQSNSPKPYIIFYATYKNKVLTISIDGKNDVSFGYSFDFESKKEECRNKDKLTLRLDKEKYLIEGKTIYSGYLANKIISEDEVLNPVIFELACKQFVKLCKERRLAEEILTKKPIRVQLVILPKDDIVIFKNPEKTESLPEFEDSFGEMCNGFADGPTNNASFISYDDEAFSLNRKTGQSFYDALGIGNNSLKMINFPGTFRISGFNWLFSDLTDSTFRSTGTNTGIYDKLAVNYSSLRSKGSTQSAKNLSMLKILCFKETQKKVEILIDENMTMDELGKRLMLDNAKSEEVSHFAFENIFIQKEGKKTIWAEYISAVRNLLSGIPVSRERLLIFYSKRINHDKMRWISKDSKEKQAAIDFFQKSEFCLRLLTKNKGVMNMDDSEQYAYKIGKIAGKFVKFKKEVGEANNSTNDILAYPKYDKAKLEFVFQRASNSIMLSKAEENKKQEIINNIKKEHKGINEIVDSNASKDYSYFFYKGLFEEI